jgi:hypothetical protein
MLAIKIEKCPDDDENDWNISECFTETDPFDRRFEKTACRVWDLVPRATGAARVEVDDVVTAVLEDFLPFDKVL